MADNNAVTPAAFQQNARQENNQQPRQGDGQQGGEIRRNRNHRRRHGGQGQGQRQQRPNDENRQQRQGEKGGKGPKEKPEGREGKPQREQGQRRKKQIEGGAAPAQGQIRREKRQRFIEDDRAQEPVVKKVETIDDIRSDNARITKEIYQVIASMKDITIE